MTNDSSIIADLDSASPEQIAEILGILGMTDVPTVQEPKAVRSERRKDGKIKCKCCGFYKKPRKVLVETGICAVCTEAVKDGSTDGVEVIGRMGKRGRNTVSVVIDGKRFKVKRLSSRHSERVAARYASKPKGYAKRSQRGSAEPTGIRKDSRLGGDREQRTPDA